jgi:hypothetical protein
MKETAWSKHSDEVLNIEDVANSQEYATSKRVVAASIDWYFSYVSSWQADGVSLEFWSGFLMTRQGVRYIWWAYAISFRIFLRWRSLSWLCVHEITVDVQISHSYNKFHYTLRCAVICSLRTARDIPSNIELLKLAWRELIAGFSRLISCIQHLTSWQR